MSRRLVDLTVRELMNASTLFEKEKYEKALEKLNKAEKLAEKAKSSDLMCRVLLHKGEVMDAMDYPEEALELYEKALDISSRLFLNEPQVSSYQKCLYNSIGLIGTNLEDRDSFSAAEKSYGRTNKFFDGITDEYNKLIAEQPENSEYLLNYLKTLKNIGAYFLIIGQPEKQIPLTNSTLETFRKILILQPENPNILEQLDLFVRKLGEEFLENELFEDAKKLYDQLQEIYRSLLEKYPDNEIVIHYFIFSYGYLGDLQSIQGYPEKMEETYLQALSIVEDNLRKNPEDAAFLVNRGKIYEEIGLNYSESGDPEKANSFYEKALANFEGMTGKYPDDQDYQFKLTETFGNLGKLFAKIKRIEKAKQCYMYKIKIYESLFENGPEDEDLKMEIIDTFTQIGNLYAEAGDRDQAKEYYEKAIEGYEMLLSENPESTDFEIGISDVLTALGDMYAKVEHEDVESEDETEDAEFEIAREYYEKALKLNEKEFGRYPDDSTCQDELVRTLGKIGDSFAAQERYIDAVPYYRRIIEIKEQAVRDNPVEWIYIMTLTNSLYQLGYLYGQIGEIELEKQQYSKAEELFSRLLHDEKISLPVKQILAFDVQGRGIDLLNSRKYDSAKGALDLALEFFENEYEKNPKEPENYPFICEALHQSGRLQQSLENFEEAAKIFDSLLPAVEKLLESNPENPENAEYREKAGINYTDAGEVYYLIEEYEKSKQSFKRALDINEVLLDEEPDNPIYKINQAETFEKYAKLLSKLGRNEEAEDYSTKSKEIYRKLAEEDCGEKDTDE